MRLRTWGIAAIVAVVALGAIAGAVFAAAIFTKSLDATVNIVSKAEFEFYEDDDATEHLEELEMGDMTRGETKSFTFYIKNTGDSTETLTANTSSLPADIGTMEITFDGEVPKDLAAGSVAEVVVTIEVADDADLGSAGFDIPVNAAPVTGPAATPAPVSYSSTIQPILTQNCTGCHGAAAGLSFGSYSGTMASVVPGDASASLLYKSLTGSGASQMPPGGALSAAQRQSVANWINQGALNN